MIRINGGQATLGANTFTGAQVAPSLALGGATIGSNALAVTGTAFVSGNVAVAGSTFDPFGRGYTNMLSVGSINSGTSAIEINAGAAFNAFLDLGVNGVRVAALVGNATNASFVTAATGTSIIIGVNSQNDLTIANGGIAAIRGTLAIGGATIGTNALAVTGTAAVTGSGSFSGGLSVGTTGVTAAGDVGVTGKIYAIGATQLLLQGGDGIALFRNSAGTDFSRLMFGGTTSSYPSIKRNAAAFDLRLADDSGYASLAGATLTATADAIVLGTVYSRYTTALPAGGTANSGIRLFSTANFGIFAGSGAPTLSAAQGSLYLRSDGTGTNDRMYVNTNGSTTWTAVTTVA